MSKMNVLDRMYGSGFLKLILGESLFMNLVIFANVFYQNF